MRNLAIAALLVSGVLVSPAHAAVQTIGGGYAKSCFEAADAQYRTRQALDVCDKALTEEVLTREDRVATFVNRGIVKLRRGDLPPATADFDAALALNPMEPDAWLNKAILNVRYGNSAAALPLVAKAIELKTRRPALAYFVRAVAYEDSGNIPAAYHDLQHARALDPSWNEPVVELRRFQVRQR
ncbi:MAG: tetratricopeptide repeat protein [Sphingomonas sp.]|uniref:tetratricopeptide repeat protein n=1 Tax=Sphingomonas sp. TaxID=28214 RepID=UPI00179DCC77|nr:hypothetical protein [Sphingomonas sp.]MBA3666167.1 tetratricopeptide repeat protein [Sphingomonas sp.]